MTTPRVGKRRLTNAILIHGKKKKVSAGWSGRGPPRPRGSVCESPSLTAQRGPKTGRRCPEAAARRAFACPALVQRCLGNVRRERGRKDVPDGEEP